MNRFLCTVLAIVALALSVGQVEAGCGVAIQTAVVQPVAVVQQFVQPQIVVQPQLVAATPVLSTQLVSTQLAVPFTTSFFSTLAVSPFVSNVAFVAPLVVRHRAFIAPRFVGHRGLVGLRRVR